MPWTDAQEDALRRGVIRFGVGRWELILHAQKSKPRGHAALELRDMWRKLKEREPEEQKERVPRVRPRKIMWSRNV